MPIQPQPGDKRLQRFAWLLQISHAGRMFEFHHSPQYVEKPRNATEQLENALCILLRILRTQIETPPVSVPVRLGSMTSWAADAHLNESAPDEHDPQLDCASHPVNQDTETFPEVIAVGKHHRAYNELRTSRYALLKRLRVILYSVQDKGNSVTAAWKALWSLFMYAMGSNRYLREWHDGVSVSHAWTTGLCPNGREEFTAKYFDLSNVAMDHWQQAYATTTVEDPKQWRTEEYHEALRLEYAQGLRPAKSGRLGQEVLILVRIIVFLQRYFSDYVIRMGFNDECSNVLLWASKVLDRADLPDRDCPICFLAYQLEAEVAPDAEPPHTVPVKTSCNHIVCSPCLNEWAASGADNHRNCPLCRAHLPPANPHKHKADLLAQNVNAIYEDGLQPPLKAAALAMDAINTYLAGLPTSIRDTTPPPTAIEVYNLHCWRHNILVSPATEVSTSVLLCNTPMVSETYDEIGQAALHCLHLARERLHAFLEADQDRYRTACTSGLYARANLLNMVYGREMQELFKLISGWVEIEEEERRQRIEETERGGLVAGE